MNIERNTYLKPSFTSLKNPIKPFAIKTPQGVVQCREVNYKHPPRNCFYRKLAEFFMDNYSNTSSDPIWALCREGSRDAEVYEQTIKQWIKELKFVVQNRASTLLYAKDKEGKICSAIVSKPFNLNKQLKDAHVLYISDVAVNKNCRGSHIASAMLNRILSAERKDYTDAFLVAFRESLPFYLKNGFKEVQYNKRSQQYFIEEMLKERPDFPDFVEFVSKPLEDKSPISWCKRIWLKSTV